VITWSPEDVFLTRFPQPSGRSLLDSPLLRCLITSSPPSPQSLPDIYEGYQTSPRSRYSDWLRAGRPRDRSSTPGRVKNCLFSTSSRQALGSTQHPIQWVPGVKRPGREADQSPLASAEVKKMWLYTSTSPYAFVA
jgi:hypothetical protein